MAEIIRTNLDWARDVARAYRRALRAADPKRCAELDTEAVNAGQRWIAPTLIPAEAAIEILDSVLSPIEIAEHLAFPVNTIYGWVSKGLLKPSPVDTDGKPLPADSPARYRVRDVMNVEARRKVRRLDIA